jgi:beta-N-acetylhexosaminidase
VSIRRLALAGLVVACLTAAAVAIGVGGREPAGDSSGSGGPDGGDSEEETGVTALPLPQQVGQLVLLRFDGPELPDASRQALRSGEATGAVLFGDNVVSEDQLTGLIRDIQSAARGSAIVAVDQEGGSIRIVPFAPPEASAAAVTDPDTAQRTAREAGRGLADLGVNVNLAPVADVASVEGSVVAGRAYPGDAGAVAALVEAAVRGFEPTGVAATAKHFPGIGAAFENTDDAAVTIEHTRAELDALELEPFRAAVAADVPLVMASHVLYPALDKRRIASQSRAMLEGVLRDDLGYEGVIVTDSLESEAVLSRTDTPTAALRSLRAGVDLMLTTSIASQAPVHDLLLEEAERSDRLRARVEESATRMLALKERLGLRAPGARS